MPNRFSFSAWLFLRALALIYLVAFVSFWTQSAGLVGPHGILPAQDYFDAVRAQMGPRAYFELPSLCWWIGADHALAVLCAIGVVLAGLLFAGIAPALSLAGMWACYLSLCGAGQVFYGYQWDALLLEATLPAIFLSPWGLRPGWHRVEPPRLALLLMWWLLFRLMVLSGAVKLGSGDVAWRGLSALAFHYESQPLPTPLSWFFHQLPLWFHQVSCVVMFVIELVAPFAVFAPRSIRHVGALLIAGFMVLIALTGNYTFFDFLTIALCLLWLDDAWWQRVLRRPVLASVKPHRVAATWPLRAFAIGAIIYTSILAMPRLARIDSIQRLVAPLDAWVRPFRSFNSYGLFAVMTHPRPELIIEGSDDRRTWQPYELPYKPGDLRRSPGWIAPFQPRLDWQLWFAALESPGDNPWMLTLSEHLLRGTPQVLALFAHNPFPKSPPKFIRVVRYEYHFTDAVTRRRTGQVWQRSPLDYYVQPVSLG
ncbi:MAG: hypothetical protein JWM32_2952 [Verrucomicrobia bacterium]|nr:hypothetical protein [Verrucomicrobiota bacterium]